MESLKQVISEIDDEIKEIKELREVRKLEELENLTAEVLTDGEKINEKMKKHEHEYTLGGNIEKVRTKSMNFIIVSLCLSII